MISCHQNLLGKVIILDMDYADGREIRYKIQPDFSDIEEFQIPTTTSSGVPSDETLDLYYPVIVSDTGPRWRDIITATEPVL